MPDLHGMSAVLTASGVLLVAGFAVGVSDGTPRMRPADRTVHHDARHAQPALTARPYGDADRRGLHRMARSGATGDQGGVAGDGPPCGDVGLTQNADNTTIEPAGIVQCTAGSDFTLANALARSFTLGAALDVCAMSFGVDSNAGGDWPVTVNLYEGDIQGAFSDLDLRGSTTVDIPDDTSQALVEVAFDTPVSFAGGERMIVELAFDSRDPAEGGDGGALWLGANSFGQTGPTYLRADACGLTDFTDLAELGFATAHLVLTVYGDQASVGCIGDIDQSGEVDGADLAALLGTWGPCGDPDNCPADLDDSDVVDGGDLAILLGTWGECPGGGEPIGACCFDDGGCDELTADACASAGGAFNGPFTACADVECPQPVECPVDGIDEAEPCGDDLNGGCHGEPPAYGPVLTCGDTVCGNAWADGGLRDTDWYRFTVTDDAQEITWSVEAEFFATVVIAADTCPADVLISDVGHTASVTLCLPPGDYILFVAPLLFDGLPCPGGSYVATVSDCANCPRPDGR